VVAFLLMVATVAAAQPKDILFVTSQGLAQINPDGTGLTILNLQGKAPRWSPDGTKFAFLKLTGGFQFTLFVADADGSNVRTLNANVGWTTYQWSPDATQIAFLSNGDPSTGFELFVVNADGTNLRSLGVRVGVGISDFGNPFVWTPDGSQILFVAPSGQLSYVRVSDGTVTNLPVRGAGLAYHPSGSFFVFTSQRSNNSPLELFVASPDGATVRPLNLQGTNPILSPNGQFLLFFSSSSQPQAFVVELSPTGTPVGDPVPLNVSNLSVSGSFEPWSPDSTRLVLPTESGLFVVRRDGTGLTPLNASGFDPQWRPLPRLQLTVTTDADSGAGSLREAINQANAANVTVIIRFTRAVTIRLLSPLPRLTNPNGITIIGDVDGDGTPDVVLDGSGLPRIRQAPADGLVITTPSNTVNGLVLRGFPGNGIVLDGTNATGNNIVNCTIENNGANGIFIRNGASSNTVRTCTIQNNTGDGVRIEGNASVANRLTRNIFRQNGRLGINLVGGTEDANGVTANDPGDADTGPNNLQNFPELIAAVDQGGGIVLVKGRIDTPNPTTVTIDFYGNASADPSGFGEGERLLDSFLSINADGTFQALVTGVALGEFVTAIATDANGNTSEFSRAIPVAPPPPAPQLLFPTGGIAASTTPFFRLKAPATTGLGRVQFRIELSQDNFATVARVFDQSADPTGWNKPFYNPDEEAVFQVPAGAPLPEGAWQWRAKTIDIDRQLVSGFSAVQNFVAVPPPPPPNLLEPADNAVVSPTPTFKVQGTLPADNPTRLVYFLELSQDNFATVRTVEPGTANGWDKADYGPNEVATLTLPSAQALPEGAWKWRVRAALATQPTVQSAPTSARSFTAIDNRNRIPAGLSLVGLPFIPTNPTRTGLGLASGTRIAVYDTASGNYRIDDAAEPLPIAEGKAFWVKSANPQSPQVAGTPFSFPVTVSLQQGWNAIGNPLPTSLAWRFTAPSNLRIRQGTQEFTIEDAIRKGLISPFVWVWNETASRYELVYDAAILPAQSGDPFRNDIPAFRGFWLFAKTSGLQLVIDSAPRSAVLASRSAPVKSDGFALALTVRKGGQVIGEGMVAVRPNVPSRLTIAPPPPAPDRHANALSLDDGNVVDVRPLGQSRYVWTVQVQDGDELSWHGTIPRGWQITLMDTATGTQISVRYLSRYQVSGRRSLLLIAQRDTNQPLRIVNLQTQGTRGRGVRISFGLTAPAQVKAVITTLTGRIIRVLDGGSRMAGTHQLFWRGETDGGHPAPVGVYLLRLQATDETGRQTQAVRTVMWR
jgi:parallel beta-helix repeat protein